jgi:hypothetical protein
MNADDIAPAVPPAGPERLLESHMRDFLVSNLQDALGLPLRLIATERIVEGLGRIDVYAGGPKGSLWAIELKVGTASRDAVGQLSSYLGALAAEGVEARGILVASAFDKSAHAAARAVPNVYLFTYALQFAFLPIGERKIDLREFKLSLARVAKSKTTPRKSTEADPFSVDSLKSSWPFPQDKK